MIFILVYQGQNKLFDLLVTAMWWRKTPAVCCIIMLFKSFEDVILDKRDSLWSCFVTTAKWYLPKTENPFISLNWIICSFTSWYWTVHVCEFLNLLLAVLVQLKVDPYTTALWYSTGCGHCSITRVFCMEILHIARQFHQKNTRETHV